MIYANSNRWFKKLILALAFLLFMLVFVNAAAADRDEAIEDYKEALIDLDYSESAAENAATDAVDSAINAMENSQSAIEMKYDELENRIDSMHMKDTRKDDALDELGSASGKVDSFTGLDASTHVIVETQIGNVPPRAMPDETFLDAEEEASSALVAVNRILIAPSRPGEVPEGDILEDFVPQFIRQLFRFAWLAVLIAFVVSGVMFIISMDNEERISRAKRMIYYTLLGFAFISLAFAIVKAITDIDFFRFI